MFAGQNNGKCANVRNDGDCTADESGGALVLSVLNRPEDDKPEVV